MAAAARRRNQLSQSRLCVAVGFWFVILATASAVAMAIALRTAALAHAGRTIEQLSGAAAEQVSRSLQAVDLLLQDIDFRLGRSAARQGLPIGAIVESKDVHDMLVDRVQHASQIAAASLADRDGRVVNWSYDIPIRPISLRERDFFRAMAVPGARPDLFISMPEVRKTIGDRALFISRRLGDGAEFDGIAYAIMPLSLIEQSFAEITATPGIGVTLLYGDGRIVARMTDTGISSGGVETDADYKGRLSSTRPLSYQAMRLVVSMTEEAALAGWRRQAIAIGLLAVAASGCVLLMMWALLRQIRAQQAAQSALAERHAELELANKHVALQSAELASTADELRSHKNLLAERTRTLDTTLQYIDQGILMVNADDVVVVHNSRATEILGIPEQLLEQQPKFEDVLAYQWRQNEFSRTNQDLIDFVRAGGMASTPHCYERERPNGQVIEVRSLPLPGGGMVRTYTDITERRQAQALIERAALFDELTGLPNRLSLRQRLDRQLQEQADRVALLYLNLDRFRLLNDARGHVTGDALLRAVAERLKLAVQAPDMISRTGGDEFAVLHVINAAQDNSSELAANLLRCLAEPYVIEGQRLTVTASIGVATAAPGSTTDILLRNADIAMYRAKDGGRNQLCRYEPAMAAAQQERFQIEQSLREALDTPALRLAYQPIISLESDTIAGFEALLRWNDPVIGDISPACFIPIAETTGLIMPLGRSALNWACQEAASWTKPRTVAVNLSPAQFQHDNVVGIVEAALASSGLDPARLELEVTEGMLLQDSGSVHETMLALRSLGVALTLDDFGTGHAGLSYLRRFPFQKFKIDRSFVRNLGQAKEADTIVEEMLLLARRLELQVVAEGVELESQLEHLRGLGCTYVQGYLTGRPVLAEIARTL